MLWWLISPDAVCSAFLKTATWNIKKAMGGGWNWFRIIFSDTQRY
jgi:hypothetical protein